LLLLLLLLIPVTAILVEAAVHALHARHESDLTTQFKNLRVYIWINIVVVVVIVIAVFATKRKF
jgi:hypothetical protein